MSKKDAVVLGVFLVAGLLLNASVLNNEFLSDDFRSLHRILIEKRIIYKGLFRPLIDITMYGNYLLSGLNPFSYYLFNILLHIFTAWMLYKTANRLAEVYGIEQEHMGVIAGFLFLIYPFHNEPVVWITGRLASIATLAVLIILYLSLRNRENIFPRFWVCLLIYYVALTGYESIILLPLIILLCFWPIAPRRVALHLFLLWTVVTIAFLIFRTQVSGELQTDYGSRVIASRTPSYYIGNMLKVGGRLFLPPMENSRLMSGLFALVTLLLLVLHVVWWRSGRLRRFYWFLLGSLLIALIVPALFGLSTKTSEGDRLLYFPSVFFCLMVAYGLTSIINPRIRRISLVVIAVYFLSFLRVNTLNWERASDAVAETLRIVRTSPQQASKLRHLPGDIKGAFVFRQGFPEALSVYGVPAGTVVMDSLTGQSPMPLTLEEK